MKVAPRIFLQESLVKKLNKRNAKRIEQHISISENLSPEQSARVQQYSDSLARYAQRNGCTLSFVPGENLFSNSTEMRVNKKTLSIVTDDAGCPILSFPSASLSGRVYVPEKVSGKGTVVGYLKSNIKSIINSDPSWENKLVEIK